MSDEPGTMNYLAKLVNEVFVFGLESGSSEVKQGELGGGCSGFRFWELAGFMLQFLDHRLMQE